MRAFRELLSICVCASFSFGFEGGVLDLIVSVPDLCLSFYFLWDSQHVQCCLWYYVMCSFVVALVKSHVTENLANALARFSVT